MSASALFNLEAVFEVEDYLFAYRDDLTDERSDAEVASLVKLLELDSPMKILDLACGFGRHTNRLAALGHSVTGVDYMPGFLRLAREKATELGVQVDYRQGDMRQINFPEVFDRVLLLFTSFGYFKDDENELVIKNMVSALKPGGYLMLDIQNRDVVLKDLPPADVIEKNGDLLVNRFSFDVLTGRFHNRRIVIRDGIRKDKPFSIRLYNATEVSDLLHGAGLVEYKLLGEDDQPLSAYSRRIVVIAKKPIRV
ncbi:MAG: class I SAM-dependent methyltransferase [Chloroflexi bacterium]|nr:MAG: class I SAM-dependent methyltransferase [Chloroflexota bacterium]